MALSRQEGTLAAAAGRANQKARTRSALLAAAVELVREGRPASVPAAAERALVSVATAYRYFPKADDLWAEAAFEAVDFAATTLQVDQLVAAAGDDPEARLEAVVTSIGWRMIDDPAPFHLLVRAGIDSWLAQQEAPAEDRVPVRQNRRQRWNTMVVEPLRGRLDDDELARLVGALSVGGLDPETAKHTMLRTCRWILRSAVAELDKGDAD
jgi:AcrR family transcriptional regulator